jgi:hypothetical protein
LEGGSQSATIVRCLPQTSGNAENEKFFVDTLVPLGWVNYGRRMTAVIVPPFSLSSAAWIKPD